MLDTEDINIHKKRGGGGGGRGKSGTERCVQSRQINTCVIEMRQITEMQDTDVCVLFPISLRV